MDIKGIASGINPYLKPQLGGAEAREVDSVTARSAQQVQQAQAAGDTVSISEAAKLQSLAAREALQTPDVRRERIEALKEKVQSGEYKPDSRKIASGIIKNDMELLVKG